MLILTTRVEEVDRIFGLEMGRVDMAQSEISGGFGVGLAIAERAILHGGRILACHRPGGGLDVQVILPTQAYPVGLLSCPDAHKQRD